MVQFTFLWQIFQFCLKPTILAIGNCTGQPLPRSRSCFCSERSSLLDGSVHKPGYHSRFSCSVIYAIVNWESCLCPYGISCQLSTKVPFLVCLLYCFIRCETFFSDMITYSPGMPNPRTNSWSSSDNCSVVYFIAVLVESLTPPTWALFVMIRPGWAVLLPFAQCANICLANISYSYHESYPWHMIHK